MKHTLFQFRFVRKLIGGNWIKLAKNSALDAFWIKSENLNEKHNGMRCMALESYRTTE